MKCYLNILRRVVIYGRYCLIGGSLSVQAVKPVSSYLVVEGQVFGVENL